MGVSRQKVMIKLALRIILDALIFVALIQGWWYFVVLLCILGVWNFGFYIEIIIAGSFYDSLYGTKNGSIYGYSGLVVSIALFIILSIFKRIIRVKDR